MDVLATFPAAGRAPARIRAIRHVLSELFSGPNNGLWRQAHAVRTWAPGSTDDHLSIVATPDSPAAADTLRRVITRHGFEPTVEVADAGTPLSPLWNTGIGGTDLDRVATDLCRQALASVIAWSGELLADESRGTGLALDVLGAHSAATLLRSDQRTLGLAADHELFALRLLSYRSHVEGLFVRARDPEGLRRQFEEHYKTSGHVARAVVRRAAANLEAATDLPWSGEWASLVLRNHGDLRDRFRHGTLRDASVTLDQLNVGREVKLAPSAFHAEVSPDLDALLHRDPDFLAYRLLTSLLYSMLHTVGFSTAERYLFCYLLARANEDECGLSVHELQRALDDLAGRMARARGAVTAGA